MSVHSEFRTNTFVRGQHLKIADGVLVPHIRWEDKRLLRYFAKPETFVDRSANESSNEIVVHTLLPVHTPGLILPASFGHQMRYPRHREDVHRPIWVAWAPSDADAWRPRLPTSRAGKL